MIRMPRRSVTRFFIPLIDVLILLFCIFLLMEFNSESEVDRQALEVEMQSASNENLQVDLQRRIKELHRFEELRPQLSELDKVKKELEALKAASLQSLEQRTFFRVIDINRQDGTLEFYDEASPKKPLKIGDAKAAADLIERHKKEAKGREIYYYFMRSRPTEAEVKSKKLSSGYPTSGQIKRYKAMFPVANNLGEYR